MTDTYTYKSNKYNMEDIITHIRMMDEVGESFLQNIIYKSFLDSIHLLEE